MRARTKALRATMVIVAMVRARQTPIMVLYCEIESNSGVPLLIQTMASFTPKGVR